MAPYPELTIVGYNDVLTDTMVPTRVAPVYRWSGDKGGSVFLLPPFEAGPAGVAGNAVTEKELKSNDSITLFDRDLETTPEPGHTLWLGADFSPHYQPSLEAECSLSEAARSLADEARNALTKGDREAALRLSSRSRSAFGRFVDGYVVAAAVHRLEERFDQADLMKKLATRFCAETSFADLVDELLSEVRPCHRPLFQVTLAQPFFPNPRLAAAM